MRDLIGWILAILAIFGMFYVIFTVIALAITGRHLNKYDDWNDID